MKTTKFLFFIAAALTLGFTSCSEDKCDHIPPIIHPDNNPFVGSWYADGDNEEITYNESGTLYDRYCNLRRSAQTEGRWVYDEANKKLTYSYLFLGQVQFTDWTVKDLAETSVKIVSDKNGTCELQRIVAAYKLEVGESVTFSFPKEIYNYKDHEYENTYIPQSFESLNPRLASVDEHGTITATGEKGTTFIKVTTDKGVVWIRVLVGDDCMDLWYNWQSFIGADYNTLTNTLGQYSAKGDDGYSFGWDLSTFSDQAKEIDMFLNERTGKVEQIALTLKDIPEAEILAYMNAHYYLIEGMSDLYSTSQNIERSMALVKYVKEANAIYFFEPSFYIIKDYSQYIGMTKSELVNELGEPAAVQGNKMRYAEFSNYYIYTDYTIDATTGKVSTVVNKMANNALAMTIWAKIRSTFADFQDYADDSDYTNYKYALINNSNIDDATVEIIIDGKPGTGTVTYKAITPFNFVYDFESLMGKNYTAVKKVLGEPFTSVKDTQDLGGVKVDIEGSCWLMSDKNPAFDDVKIYFDSKTHLVNDIYLCFNSGYEAEVLKYLNNNYSHSDLLDDIHYISGRTVEESNAVLQYDENKRRVRFQETQRFLYKDFTYTFGMTENQIIEEFKDYRDWSNYMYGGFYNYYYNIIAFGFENGKVVDYQLAFNDDVAEQMKTIFSTKYKFIRESDDKTYLVYRDDEDLQKAKVQIQYNPTRGVAVFFNCDYYVRGVTRTRSVSTDVFKPSSKLFKQ